MKKIFLASASVSILALGAVQAFAQTATDNQSAPVPQSTPAANAPQGGAPSSVAPDGSAGIQDIIVTAQRTEQTAQKAPLPISVVKPEELVRQNIVRAEDLSRAVPALVAANNGGATTSFFLRGVGNFTANSYSDPAIAFNYDGVYLGRPSNTQGLFYDLQRVEVLKGPQGTLYGRNATGGAINVIPNRPVIGETSGDAQASYGNYNAVQAQGAINLPIGQDGAFRLAGTYNRHSGYLSDGTSDQRIWGLRGQVLANLTPNLTTRISADYAHDGGTGTGGFLYGTDLYNPATNSYTYASLGLSPSIGMHDPRSNAAIQQIFIPQVGRTAEALGTYPSLNDGFWGVTNETNWKTSAGTLTVQAAYREGDVDAMSTAAAFRDDVTKEHDQQTSVEARFAGKAGPFDYLVGAYFFKENIKALFTINQLDLTSFQNYTTGTNSKAAFGRLAYHVTPTVTLTAAGRYTDDRKKFNGVSDNYLLFCGNPAPPQDFCPNLPLEPFVSNGAQLTSFYQQRGVLVAPAPLGILGLLPPNVPSVFQSTLPINATTKTSKFTYRLAADWQATPTNLLYASFETGFHGGGFSFARGLDSFKPETIQAYTIGSKNRFFNRRVQLNIEAFYWKYKNQQFSQFGYDLGTPPSLVFYTSNVGRSTIKGVDADLDVLVTPTTRVSGSVQYLDTKYDSFITYAPNQGTPPNYNCPYTPIIGQGGTAQFQLNCSGKPGVNAPKWSLNANIEQTLTLGDYKLVAQVGTRYRGAYYIAATYQPWTYSKGAFQSDASLTLSPAGDRWFITGFINNIENKRRLIQDAPGAIGTLGAITSDPRTFGVRVGVHFK
ncbi:iron complex outermembrane receptor protein [Sphingomonas vulcanisoli]|uniref:Iron complex outermembrane receptor protein n=1 Tax=Sphingomonas vulcanisoli TaxID=1658060 RepID=A0ABX0TT46_9SPHN|nr:TonB-dependent receptor [Sphingomonas vulcanisoli]NIJ07324.1 iron complex outermembrane receptor protein [Sphingomonas vulcanisoli]